MQDLLQLLTMLFSLSDFGVSANPKAPAPAEISRYGMDDADVFAYIDVEAVLPGNYRVFTSLPDRAKDAPELRAHLTKAVAAVELGRTAFKAATNVDPVADIKSVGLWLRWNGKEPTGVMCVRGNFAPDYVTKVTHLAGGIVEVDGHKAARVGDAMVAVATKGQLLVGTPAEVEARLKKTWKRSAAGARSEAAALAGKPFFALHTSPSEAAKEAIRANVPRSDQAKLGVALAQHTAHLSLRHNGVSWSFEGTDREAYDTALLASKGILELMRASHLFTRGAVRLVLAALRAHAGDDRRVAEIIAREKDLLKLVEQLTGDGRFVATIDEAPAKRTVTVRATGKKLTDVLPLAGLAPLGGAVAFLMLRDGGAKTAVEMSSQAPVVREVAPIGRPLDVRGVYQRAKAKRAR